MRVATLNDVEKLVAYTKEIHCELRAHEVPADPIKTKIAEAKKARVHTTLVIGGRDLDAGAVSVRLHGKGPQGARPKAEVIAGILADIKKRRA